MREPRQDCLLLNMLALPGHTSEQRTGNKPKRLLTGRAPYRFESISLQQRVCTEPEGRRRRASLFCGGLLVHRIERKAGPAESPRAREPANLQQQRSMLVSLKSPKLKTIAKLEGERMEWEEALLGSWGAEIPAHPPAYYRRKAARARQFAEEATTQAMKARLLAEAVHCDQLAADAEHLADEYLGFREGDILPGLNHHGSTSTSTG